MPFLVLDFDETYTAFPKIFDTLIEKALEQKVKIIICTGRNNRYGIDNNSDVEQLQNKYGLELVYGNGLSKFDALIRDGFIPENAIWIDDTPRAIEGLNWN